MDELLTREVFYVKHDSNETEPSMDVFIPCSDSEVLLLPFLLQSIRQQHKKKISNINVVAPYSLALDEICKMENCRLIRHETAKSISKKEITFQALKYIRHLKQLH